MLHICTGSRGRGTVQKQLEAYYMKAVLDRRGYYRLRRHTGLNCTISDDLEWPTLLRLHSLYVILIRLGHHVSKCSHENLGTNKHESNELEARNLDEPSDVVAVHRVVDRPRRQVVPLVHWPAVNRQPVLGVLIFTLAEIVHHFLHNRVPASLHHFLPSSDNSVQTICRDETS